MNKNFQTILFLTTLILVLTMYYLIQPVPYCKPLGIEETTEEPDTTYSDSTIDELNQQSLKGPIAIFTYGDSMTPTIKSNQKCLCIQKENYAEGDIVAFFQKENGDYQGILHRIVEIDGDEIITRGDNSEFSDYPTTSDSLLCYVPEVKRWETLW